MSSQQRSSHLLIRLLIVNLIVSMSAGLVLARSIQPQTSGELLTNPGFEQPFVQQGSADIFIANGWTAWYITPDGVTYPLDCKNSPTPQTCKTYRVPAYHNTQPQDARQPQRARSGDSQQWGSAYATYIAGVYQRVAGLTPGTRLSFSAYMQGFNCDDDRGCFGPAGEYGKSYEPGNMQTRIGIDPAGGTDPFSSNVVWSPYQNPLDAFSRHEVEAVAQGDAVTVFLWSSPTYPELHTNIYVDDASLISVGQGPAPTTAASTPASGTPQATLPAGTGTYSVQSGDTLSAIALQYNLTLDQLLALNPGLTRDSVLQVGQVLNVGGTPAPTTQATAGATETPKPSPTSGAPTATATAGAPTATATPGGPTTYTVKSGDTLASITAQFNLSLDQLLAYNGITKDTPLLVGQTLIVSAPAVTPTPSLTPTQVTTLAVSTPTPTPPPGIPAAGLCLLAFDDANGSGTRDSGEGLVAGVKFEVKSADDKSVATYTSDGVKEPNCLTNLPDGRYSVEVTPPADQLATTDTRWSLSLLSGAAVNIVFGSQSTPTATVAPATAPTAIPAATAPGNGSSSFTLLVGGAFVLLAVAALFLGLRPRRK